MARPIARLALTEDVMRHAKTLESAGCDVNHDKDAGTLEVRDGDVVVFSAIQKGDKHQPWIVLFRESERVKWTQPNEAKGTT